MAASGKSEPPSTTSTDLRLLRLHDVTSSSALPPHSAHHTYTAPPSPNMPKGASMEGIMLHSTNNVQPACFPASLPSHTYFLGSPSQSLCNTLFSEHLRCCIIAPTSSPPFLLWAETKSTVAGTTTQRSNTANPVAGLPACGPAYRRR